MSGCQLTSGLQGIKTRVVEYGDLLEVVEVRQVGEVIKVSEGVVRECQDDKARREVLAAPIQRADAVPVQKQLLKSHTPHVFLLRALYIHCLTIT